MLIWFGQSVLPLRAKFLPQYALQAERCLPGSLLQVDREAGRRRSRPAPEGARKVRRVAVADSVGDIGHCVLAFGDQPKRFAATGLVKQILEIDAAIFEAPLKGSRRHPILLAMAFSPSCL